MLLDESAFAARAFKSTSILQNPAMLAAVYDDFEQPITIRTVPRPTAPRDGVVIEVKATGVCRSDWHGWKVWQNFWRYFRSFFRKLDNITGKKRKLPPRLR
jgi:hypothetical protein